LNVFKDDARILLLSSLTSETWILFTHFRFYQHHPHRTSRFSLSWIVLHLKIADLEKSPSRQRFPLSGELYCATDRWQSYLMSHVVGPFIRT